MSRIFQNSYKTKIQLPAQMHLGLKNSFSGFTFFLFLSTFENIIPDSVLFLLHYSFNHYLHLQVKDEDRDETLLCRPHGHPPLRHAMLANDEGDPNTISRNHCIVSVNKIMRFRHGHNFMPQWK